MAGTGLLQRTATRLAALPRPRRMWRIVSRAIGDLLPKGLYARSLIIIIAPVVLLQSVIAYTFMERHWQLVTRRLSSAVTADVAALIDIYESYPQDKDSETLTRIANDRLNLDVDILKGAKLPPAGPRPFFSILDEALSEEIRRQIRRPYWIDTVGRSSLIEIRVAIPDGVMRVTARRSMAYASNSHIFLLWMSGSSLVLLGVAILFLRNQIKPILRLAAVAESFGKGREIEFRPRGAREVRQAGHAFIEMKRRIERAMEQRTTMLNGVSHDLRTIITRFKLSLALVEQTPEVEDLQRDVDEMSRMLEAYLAFARGDSGEVAVPTDMRALLEDLRTDVERLGAHVEAVDLEDHPRLTLRPDAMRRCLFNLAANAARYGETVAITGRREARAFLVSIDDDGPGIPPDQREEVFKPFVRLDDARQDAGGSGLGLSIARDIARAHGGDVSLHDSPLGGLRATVRIPA
ncbi:MULTISPECIES: ATP-binding protein [unclassified Methylobacterium]|uniref:ATP-binding protein n=1 Tax=unclassified Methylobacterium TaxID=2615210 RepID=UPI000701DE58|nr:MULTISPECIES: ATP-binding protein [unclassified Methylobacterium]KQO71573.1 ATPase [Methylobacterium sp. Leaf88]KQP60038.1 ATPase [Methylobacterium sp. Leaf111]KQT79737.1 ATPase [Methylobacterium sp. Leaf465]